jgi:predicted transcriptional regulator
MPDIPRGGHPRFTVTLPAEVIAKLDRLAHARGQKRAAVIREAVILYLRWQAP